MRDKIVIRGKGAYNTTKRPPAQKKKEKGRDNIRLKRSVEFRETNNALVAISLESTIGSCWVCDILFFSHSSTNWLEDWKEHNSFDRNHHRKFPRKQKEIHQQGSFGRRPISLSSTVGSCSLLDMWCD